MSKRYRKHRPIQQKVNPAYQALGMTYMADIPQPHTMARNAKAYVEEGFTNDTIFKVVSYLVKNGAAIPPVLYTDSTCQTEIKKHPLLDKLARPNPEQDGVLYRESILGWYFLTGNSFQYAIRAGKSGPPDELWTLESTKVKPIPSKTRGIIGYEFEDFPKEMNPIDPALIGHMRSWNPKDPIFGMSPLEAGALLVDQQSATRKWNLALMQNFAKPSGAWSTDTILSPNDRKKTEDRVNEKFAGARNAGRAPVLDGGLKWQQAGLPPSELDWLESMQYISGQLANLYDMPPQLVGDTSASTYNNMKEAKAASYTEAMFPVNDKLYSIWNMWLVPMYPDLCDNKGRPVAYLYYDKLTIEVLQEALQLRETAKVDRATKIYLAGGIDLYTYQEMCEIEPDKNGKGIYRVGLILVPSDKLQDYAEQALTLPAAPPTAAPEPLDGQPPASGTVPDGGNAGAGQQQQQEPPPDDKRPPKQEPQKSRQALRTKTQTTTTHLEWVCMADACEFCKQNDGEVRAVGEEFPNGVTTPEDCHKFCKCEANELALPGDVNPDDLTSDQLSIYIVGVISSRHDRDVAAQQQADEEDDGEDDSDSVKTIRLEERRRRREEYRAFKEAARV